jgi:hypothetical protein
MTSSKRELYKQNCIENGRTHFKSNRKYYKYVDNIRRKIGESQAKQMYEVHNLDYKKTKEIYEDLCRHEEVNWNTIYT